MRHTDSPDEMDCAIWVKLGAVQAHSGLVLALPIQDNPDTAPFRSQELCELIIFL